MNIENLKKQLTIDEGCKYYIYLDSLGYATFGIGHLVTPSDPEYKFIKDVKAGKKILVSTERVNQAFEADVKIACDSCRKVFKDFDNFCDELKEIIANMMFNLGLARFKQFKRLIAGVEKKDCRLAAKSMQESLWYKQVKGRAERLVKRMNDLALCSIN